MKNEWDKRIYWEKITPINSLDGTQVMEFEVKGNEDFIDLNNCIFN